MFLIGSQMAPPIRTELSRPIRTEFSIRNK